MTSVYWGCVDVEKYRWRWLGWSWIIVVTQFVLCYNGKSFG